MRKLGKLTSVVLSAVMAVSMLAGCGNQAKSGAFKIGAIGPFTGDAAIYGLAVKNSIEIAVEEINEA